MNKKLVTTILLIFVLINCFFTQTIDNQNAIRAAITWLNSSSSFFADGIKYTPDSSLIEIKDNDGYLVAYVMQLSPRGNIVISAENEINPIIAFSGNSNFNVIESNQNVLLSLLRNDLHNRMIALKNGMIKTPERILTKDKWAQYIKMGDLNGKTLNKVVSTPSTVEVAPFLTSRWNQAYDGGGQPAFNYYTPNNYVCGCVATALGQILNYYRWPISGTGSHSYTWNTSILSANFGITAYDWTNIMDDYKSSGTESQRQAVGLLTYHCGVAVDMDYAAGGSSASLIKVPGALTSYFRSEGNYVSISASDLYERLYNNMLLLRPCEIGIRNTSNNAGHAVIADGVGHDSFGTKYYHINFGWSGIDDEWYNLPALAESFNTIEDAVVDILPLPAMINPGAANLKNFTLSWNTSARLNASKYELQQLAISSVPSSFTDGAESGAGNWNIENYWEATNSRKQTGSFAFRGYVGAPELPRFSILSLTNAFKVSPSTSISFWWGINYFADQEVRLEISTDNITWNALKTYNKHNENGTISWTFENSINLSPYVNKFVMLRFVLEFNSGTYYNGAAYNFVGFFIDDFNISNANFGSNWMTIDNNLTTNSRSITAAANGDYLYRVRAFTDSKWCSWSDMVSTSVEDVALDVEPGTDVLPEEFALCQNYPNPFNPSTTIQYSIPVSHQSGAAAEKFVTLKVYDILGNELMTLVNGNKQPGSYEVKFDAGNLSSGVYLYKLSAGNYVNIKKMLLMR